MRRAALLTLLILFAIGCAPESKWDKWTPAYIPHRPLMGEWRTIDGEPLNVIGVQRRSAGKPVEAWGVVGEPRPAYFGNVARAASPPGVKVREFVISALKERSVEVRPSVGKGRIVARSNENGGLFLYRGEFPEAAANVDLRFRLTPDPRLPLGGKHLKDSWVDVKALILDPAPLVRSDPRGTTIRRDLGDGLTATILLVEHRYGGRPREAWAPDGGAPAVDPDALNPANRFGVHGEEEREIVVEIAGRPMEKFDFAFDWRPEKPAVLKGGWTTGIEGGRSPKHYHRVRVLAPLGKDRLNLRLGVTDRRWSLVDEEPPGKFGLFARVTTPPATATVPNRVWIEYLPPLYVRNDQLDFVAFDDQGNRLAEVGSVPLVSEDGPSTPERRACFKLSPGRSVSKVRLSHRAYRWIEFTDIAMNPNSPMSAAQARR